MDGIRHKRTQSQFEESQRRAEQEFKRDPDPALSALGDHIEAQFNTHSGQFPEIKDSDFAKRQGPQ